MKWVAYCIDGCGQIERCNNGVWIENVAKKHAMSTGHEVIVGYYTDCDEAEPDPAVLEEK